MVPSLSSALFEEAIILVGAAVLFTHAGFRRTVSAAPRALLWVTFGMLNIWFISQLAEIGTATYPFMSWNMYGESLHDAPIEGYRLRGVDCEGNEYRVPWTGGALERRPLLGFAIPHAYHEEEESGLAIGAGGSTTDSLLLMVFDSWNRAPDKTPLCALQLQRIVVPASQVSQAPLPPYETVRIVRGR